MCSVRDRYKLIKYDKVETPEDMEVACIYQRIGYL